MKILVFLLLAVFFIGCSSKPEIITKTQYQDVYIPVKCQVKIPQKPKFDKKGSAKCKGFGGLLSSGGSFINGVCEMSEAVIRVSKFWFSKKSILEIVISVIIAVIFTL